MSGIFHHGPPERIVRSWQTGELVLVLSPDVLIEYNGIWARLAPRYPTYGVDLLSHLLARNTRVVRPDRLPHPVCADPSDDMFLECALESGCRPVISRDRELQAVSGYAGIEVVSPRVFVGRCL
jgi:predicted nucleic acid-binding protein